MAADDVRVRIGGETVGLDQAIKRAEGMVNRFQKAGTSTMASFAVGATRALASFTAGIGAAAGIAGLGFLIKSSISAASSIADTADKVGLGVEALQEYRYAAEQAGVSQSTFDMAIQRFSRRFGEAVQGAGELKDTLKLYGIETRNADGSTRNLTDVLDDYADAIKGAGSQQERLRLAFKGFDSEGAALVNLFKEGSDGIERFRQEARDLGLVLDEVMVREAEAAGDQLERVGNAIRVNVTRAVLGLTPTIVSLAEAFSTQLLPAIKEVVNFILPERLLPSEEIKKRIGDVGTEIETLTTRIAEAQARILRPGGKNEQAVKAMTERVDLLRKKQADLNVVLEERVRKEQLFASATKGSAAAVDTSANKVGDLVKALQFERDQLSRTEAEQRLYSEAKKAGVDVTAAFRAQISPLVDSIMAEKDALQAAKDAAKEYEKAMEALQSKGKAVFDATRTDVEKLNLTVGELTEMLEAGAIDLETYARATAKAHEEFGEEGRRVFEETRTAAELYAAELIRINQLLDEGEISADTYGRAVVKAQDDLAKKGKETNDIFKDVTVSLSSGFADAVVEGRKFGDVLDGLVKDIAKLIIQTQLLAAARAGAKALGVTVASDKGNVFNNGRIIPHAMGGILNSPIAFPMAGGATGTAAESGPEAIMPLARDGQGRLGVRQAAANVQVNVYTPPGTQAQTQERDGPQGKSIDVIITELVAGKIGQPGNPINRALTQNFGLNPRTVGR